MVSEPLLRTTVIFLSLKSTCVHAAENLILRQQLIVLRRKSPTRVRLWNIDRLLDALATIKKAPAGE